MNRYINALVLLSLTNRYDCVIYNQIHEKWDIEVTMPFGSSQTFHNIVQWLVHAQEPEDFAPYQLCAEFARFYGISLPNHPDQEVVNQKLDDIDFPPRQEMSGPTPKHLATSCSTYGTYPSYHYW